MKDKLLTLPIQEMTDISFSCDCGRSHSVKIGTLLIGEGVSRRVPEIAAAYDGRVLVVADANTYRVLGERVLGDLKDAGREADAFIYPDAHLHPDAYTLGRLFIEASDETRNYRLLIAVGSGTINDVTRIMSGRLGLPYMIVGTAPSMDGYAGTSSPIVCRDNKISFYSHYADAIIADTVVMGQAPNIMIAAGLGDVLGKYVALADWLLDERVMGAYRCELLSQLMMNAVEKCAASAGGVARRDSAAIGSLAEGLVLSGMVMGLAGVTRPASGCEHHITHYCDIDAIRNGRDYTLHGNTVGISTIAMLRLYELARADGLTDIVTPPADDIRRLIAILDGPTRPRDIGIADELYCRAMLEAKNLRPQYSILKHADKYGKLEEYVDIIAGEIL